MLNDAEDVVFHDDPDELELASIVVNGAPLHTVTDRPNSEDASNQDSANENAEASRHGRQRQQSVAR